MLADTIRSAREKRGWSQRELAEKARVSRKHLSDVESGANVSIKVIERIAAALELAEVSIGDVLLRSASERLPNTAFIRERASRIARSAAELMAEIDGERGRVLRFSDVHPPRILFDEDQEQIDALKKALARSPSRDVEWRAAFKGRGRHRVARSGDAAAGHGAEAIAFLAEEDVLMREIPEHYWDLGARMVMRVVGDSLSRLGYVDRDLLFIRPATSAENNDVVVCTLDDLVYVKVLRRTVACAWLLSANESFSPMPITDSSRFVVHGVVVGRSGYALPGGTLPDPE